MATIRIASGARTLNPKKDIVTTSRFCRTKSKVATTSKINDSQVNPAHGASRVSVPTYQLRIAAKYSRSSCVNGVHCSKSGPLISAMGHVWTAPPWQELSELLQHWSGAVMCPACLCGGEAAGHNALRGSGPNQKHAFKDALTQTGSPDPWIDLVCITSSCPRQFLQNFKRRRRCLASPP